MNYDQRLARLQKTLEGCDALVIDDPTDLFYMTGLDLSAGKLIVHAKGALLFVDRRYSELCKKKSPFPVEEIDSTANLEKILQHPALAFIRTLAFDSQKTTYQTYLNMQQTVRKELLPLNSPIDSLRIIKDPEEIEALKKAGALGSEGFDFLCTFLREGITEAEAATELEIFWKRKGGKRLAFDPIIAFGENSSMPHYRPGNVPLRPGQIVLIDIGVTYQHYHSDMTRVVFFGTPHLHLLAIHAIVKKAQQAALSLCRPGTTLGALDEAARSLITAEGYGENFTHNLGHGVGLDIHESPSVKNKPPYNTLQLAPGMVITIEPGIYIPGLGGVRLEDTVAITANGCENLTNRSTEPKILIFN